MVFASDISSACLRLRATRSIGSGVTGSGTGGGGPGATLCGTGFAVLGAVECMDLAQKLLRDV